MAYRNIKELDELLEKIKDEKLKHDLYKLIFKQDFIRRVLSHFPKADRILIINTMNMSLVEKFVYSSYFNHYSRQKRNMAPNKKPEKLSYRTVAGNIARYYKNYVFNSNTRKMIKKYKNKAYYDIFRKA